MLYPSKNEKELMREQDTIKTYLECIAVFDLDNEHYTTGIYQSKNELDPSKKDYKLYVYKYK